MRHILFIFDLILSWRDNLSMTLIQGKYYLVNFGDYAQVYWKNNYGRIYVYDLISNDFEYAEGFDEECFIEEQVVEVSDDLPRLVKKQKRAELFYFIKTNLFVLFAPVVISWFVLKLKISSLFWKKPNLPRSRKE